MLVDGDIARERSTKALKGVACLWHISCSEHWRAKIAPWEQSRPALHVFRLNEDGAQTNIEEVDERLVLFFTPKVGDDIHLVGPRSIGWGECPSRELASQLRRQRQLNRWWALSLQKRLVKGMPNGDKEQAGPMLVALSLLGCEGGL